MNPIATAAAGMTSAFGRFDSAATNLSQSVTGQSTSDPATAAADEISAKQQVLASTATFHVADQMLKALLDIKV
jgi:hypothetical protein